MSMTTNLYEGHIEKDAREFLDKQVSLEAALSVERDIKLTAASEFRIHLRRLSAHQCWVFGCLYKPRI